MSFTSNIGKGAGFLLDGIVRWLALSRIHPNMLTAIGLIINAGAAVAFGAGKFMAGALIVIGAGLFDMVDGRVARHTNTATPFGAFFDSVIDRYSDLAMVDLSRIPRDRIAFGSRVVLYDLQKEAEIEYKLVSSEESDAAKGLISTTSPIGRGLMGKHVGDVVKVQTPAGVKEFEVLKANTIYDE